MERTPQTPRTQAEMDATDREFDRLTEWEKTNPQPEVDDPEYVPLPTQEGQVVATMIQKKNTPET